MVAIEAITRAVRIAAAIGLRDAGVKTFAIDANHVVGAVLVALAEAAQTTRQTGAAIAVVRCRALLSNATAHVIAGLEALAAGTGARLACPTAAAATANLDAEPVITDVAGIKCNALLVTAATRRTGSSSADSAARAVAVSAAARLTGSAATDGPLAAAAVVLTRWVRGRLTGAVDADVARAVGVAVAGQRTVALTADLVSKAVVVVCAAALTDALVAVLAVRALIIGAAKDDRITGDAAATTQANLRVRAVAVRGALVVALAVRSAALIGRAGVF